MMFSTVIGYFKVFPSIPWLHDFLWVLDDVCLYSRVFVYFQAFWCILGYPEVFAKLQVFKGSSKYLCVFACILNVCMHL